MQLPAQQVWPQQMMMKQRAMTQSLNNPITTSNNSIGGPSAIQSVTSSHLLGSKPCNSIPANAIAPHQQQLQSQTQLQQQHQQQQQQQPQSHVRQMNNTIEPLTAKIPIDEIGASFVSQYFKIMKSSPRELPLFYSNDSFISRTTCSMENDTINYQQAVGTYHITQLLYRVHASGIPLNRIIIKVMHCQETIGHSILIHIFGALQFIDNTEQNFSMITLLMPQNRPSNHSYYILNDSFIEHKSPQPIHDDTTIESYAQKAGSLPPSGSPQEISVASLLPMSNTAKSHYDHLVENDNCYTKTHAHDQHVQQNIPSQKAKLEDHHDAPAQQYQQYETTANQKENLEDLVIECEDSLDDIGHNEQQYVGSNTVVVPEKMIECKQVDKPSEHPQQQQKPLQHQTNPAKMMASSEILKPRTLSPIDKSLYSKQSYVGALLTGDLSPVCQIGYSVPGVERLRQQENPTATARATPTTSTKPRQSRNKTVWIAHFPKEISDEIIKQSIADQLKASTLGSGHVIRLDRLIDQAHGYVELSSEASAEYIVTEGLIIQGRQYQVDFANPRTRNKMGMRRDQASPGTYQRKKPQNSQRHTPPEGSRNAGPSGEDGWTLQKRRGRQNQSSQSKYMNDGQKKYNNPGRSRRLEEESRMSVPQPVN